MPSILKVGDRRVLRYLYKYGFDNIRLIYLIMDPSRNLDQVIQLEQYYIDNLPTSLNVDRTASGTGFHTPMTEDMRIKLRLERGLQVFIYNASTLEFLYMFDSKQHLYNTLKVHHKSLNWCIANGSTYRDKFIFALEALTTLDHTNPIALDSLILMFKSVQQPRWVFYGENIENFSQSRVFKSLDDFCTAVGKGDRTTVRNHVNGTKTTLYRKV